jgi:RimJ/RimL family protein N-acetyltransferase
MNLETDPNGEPYFVTGEKVALGTLTGDMLPLCERWFNDLRVSRTLGVDWRPVTSQMKERHLHEMLTSSNPFFFVYVLGTAQPIGITGLDHVNHEHDTAEFSIMIGEPSAWGKGYGTEATTLTLNYAFDVLGLYNVWLQVSANNPGAVRAYEKTGFKTIGVRRRSVRIGRELVDDVYMDAVADDFEPSALHRVMHPPEESR